MNKAASLKWLGLGVLAILLASAAPPSRAAESASTEAWLGVYSQELTRELRDGLGYRGTGVLITQVLDDSPARRAGLEKGDVLVSVNQNRVDSPDALAREVRSHDPGDQVSIRIVRDGANKTLTVRLADRSRSEDEPDIRIERKSGNHDMDFGDLDELGELPNKILADPGLKKLMRDGKAHSFEFQTGRGRLGVRIEDLSADLGAYFNRAKGALVLEVVDDSPAQRAGIKAGDVISHFGNETIDSAADLVDAVRGKNGRVTVELYRHGARQTVDVELEALETRSLRSGPRAFSWRSDGRSPRRMWIDGSGDQEDLRRELSDLRDELKKLHEQLDDLKQHK